MANGASAGHRLGQIIGDWFEEYFVLPLLQKVAGELGLYLDSRFVTRSARGEKVLWSDSDGNLVDYDFVFELDGTDSSIGLPVGFIESFWRRGSRHSKDKARDDSGKLLPMRAVHPTARFLGIIAGGDFTGPARTLVASRGIGLFYIPKGKVIAAFADCGITVDYPDTADELTKAGLADAAAKSLNDPAKHKVSERLTTLIGEDAIRGYVDRVRGALRSLPQEFRLVGRCDSKPVVFETIGEVHSFLDSPRFDFDSPQECIMYCCVYSDGSEFEQTVASVDEVRKLHNSLERLADHMANLPR